MKINFQLGFNIVFFILNLFIITVSNNYLKGIIVLYSLFIVLSFLILFFLGFFIICKLRIRRMYFVNFYKKNSLFDEISKSLGVKSRVYLSDLKKIYKINKNFELYNFFVSYKIIIFCMFQIVLAFVFLLL